MKAVAAPNFEVTVQGVIDSYYAKAAKLDAHAEQITKLIPVVFNAPYTDAQIDALVAARHALQCDAEDFRRQASKVRGIR